MDLPLAHAELVELEGCLWILQGETTHPSYNFRFDSFLPCRRPWSPPDHVRAIARVGAIANYEATYQSLQQDGITLIHDCPMHLLASELPHWHPLIADLTPRSYCVRGKAEARQVATELGWPVFLKGARQTSRHKRSLSIIETPEQLETALDAYADDPILRWQQLVLREYIPLRRIEEVDGDRLPSSFEFRTFWWRGQFAGIGRYWWEGKPYALTPSEESHAVSIAQEAARRIAATFLVVDVAQAQDGRCLVIECNDGQESGYAGVNPIAMWQRIVATERRSAG